jgi:predicted dehydrogenase
MSISRRSFIATTAAASAATMLTTSRVRGANDDVRVAVIGVGGKGSQHTQVFSKLKGVRLVAIADPDTAQMDKCKSKLKVDGLATHQDLRAVLEDKNIDAVVVATPNHWHALAAVWACQAGKDVYVEKPVSYNIWESQQEIAAAKKYNRIVQAGTQRRSSAGLKAAFDELRGGALGKIQRVRVLHWSPRGSIGKPAAPVQPPATVNYDIYQGPAPLSPLVREKFHYDWHWFWETGNGELGNNGPHTLDLARWVLGYETLAPRVMSVGGRYVWDDNGQTPNTHVVFYDYQPAPIICEVRNLPEKTGSKTADVLKGTRVGIIVECEGGYYAGLDGGVFYDKDGKVIKKATGDGGGKHAQNFIDAVRSRKTSDLNAPITTGHLSCGLCHQGNISHRLGTPSSPGNIREVIKNQPMGEEVWGRFVEHTKANNVDLEKATTVLGPVLTFDTKTETWTGPEAAKANALMKREYRAPYVLPQIA